MRWRTLVSVHALVSIGALALAAPFALLATAVVGALPDGDLALWSGGGEVAVDAAIRLRPFAGTALWLGAGTLCLWAFVAPLGTGLLLDAHLRRTDPGLSRIGAVARTLWGALLAQRAAAVAALAFALALGATCARLAGALSADWPSAARQTLLLGAAWIPGLALAALAGAATDLAHAMTTRGTPGRGAMQTWLAAARLATARPLRTAGPWALTMLAVGLLTLVSAMLAEQLGGRPGVAALGLFLVQQLVAFARTALRSAWLETAIGLTAPDGAA